MSGDLNEIASSPEVPRNNTVANNTEKSMTHHAESTNLTWSRGFPVLVIPAQERVKKSQTLSFRGVGPRVGPLARPRDRLRPRARNPSTLDSNLLGIQVFLASGIGPSDRPGMTFLGKSNWFGHSQAGTHVSHGHRLELVPGPAPRVRALRGPRMNSGRTRGPV